MQDKTKASKVYLDGADVFIAVGSLLMALSFIAMVYTTAWGQAPTTLPQLELVCKGDACIPGNHYDYVKYRDHLGAGSIPTGAQTQSGWTCSALCGADIPRVTGIIDGVGISTTIGYAEAGDTLSIGWMDNDHAGRTFTVGYCGGAVLLDLKADPHNVDTGYTSIVVPADGELCWGPATESGYGVSEIIARPEATSTATNTATSTSTATATPEPATATPTDASTATPPPPTFTATATATRPGTTVGTPTATVTPQAAATVAPEPTCEEQPEQEKCVTGLPEGWQPLFQQYLPVMEVTK